MPNNVILRVEAVNLDAVLADTNDLSTARGSGLRLLQAAREAATWAGDEVKTISSGASAAILSAPTVEAAKIAQGSVVAKLQEAPWHHFTVRTTAIEATEADFPSAEKSSLAAVRWQQQRTLSLAIPTLSEDKTASRKVCELDCVRPATTQTQLPGKTAPSFVSQSVFDRRQDGRKARQRFYAREVGQAADGLDFTDEFETLANPGDLDVGVLKNKIAVIYADGNKFGNIARGCTSDIALGDWDGAIKRFRKQMLSALLVHAAAPSTRGRMQTIDGKLRLETLMWGGDEYLFVVPAWCGLSVWRLLHANSKDWRFNNKPLTHAYSVVFAHRKAPIQRLIALSKALAEQGKEAQPEKNSLTWTSLESFDHMGMDPRRAFERRSGDKLKWADATLRADEAVALDDFLREQKTKLPRSQIVAGAMYRVRDHVKDAESKRAHALRQVHEKVPEIEGLLKGFGSETRAWTMLADSWDYFGLPLLQTPAPNAQPGVR